MNFFAQVFLPRDCVACIPNLCDVGQHHSLFESNFFVWPSHILKKSSGHVAETETDILIYPSNSIIMHVLLPPFLFSLLSAFCHLTSSTPLSKRHLPTYINRIGGRPVRLNVCSDINSKMCILAWDPNPSYLGTKVEDDPVVYYDVTRSFSVKSIEIPYGVTCDLCSVPGCNEYHNSPQPPRHQPYKESPADVTWIFDKHGGQAVKSLKCGWTGGTIPDPLPKEIMSSQQEDWIVRRLKGVCPMTRGRTVGYMHNDVSALWLRVLIGRKYVLTVFR